MQITPCSSLLHAVHRMELRAVYSQTRHSWTTTNSRTATNYPDASAGPSAMNTVGYGMTRRLADKIFTQTGASSDDAGVVEQLSSCQCLLLTRYTLESELHRRADFFLHISQLIRQLDCAQSTMCIVSSSEGIIRKALALLFAPVGFRGSTVRWDVCGQPKRWAR